MGSMKPLKIFGLGWQTALILLVLTVFEWHGPLNHKITATAFVTNFCVLYGFMFRFVLCRQKLWEFGGSKLQSTVLEFGVSRIVAYNFGTPKFLTPAAPWYLPLNMCSYCMFFALVCLLIALLSQTFSVRQYFVKFLKAIDRPWEKKRWFRFWECCGSWCENLCCF